MSGTQRPSLGVWRYIILATLFLLAAVGLAHLVLYGGLNTPAASAGAFLQCEADPQDYHVVKLYDGQGKLEFTIYAYSGRDEISTPLIQYHNKERVDLPGHLVHKFYQEVVCGNSTSCQGKIVLDIGAFIGTHGLFLAKQGAEVHAFEPYEPQVSLLRCSVGANRLNNMTVVKEGVSRAVGEECLILPASNTIHMAWVAPLGVPCASKENTIKVVTLDHYWENVLGKRDIEFIKMDTEGHEFFALEGAKKLLAEAPPRYMLVEYYPRMMKVKQVDTLAFWDLIWGANYRTYDCKQQTEVTRNSLADMSIYDTDAMTDLLLVRSKDFPADKPLPAFTCAS